MKHADEVLALLRENKEAVLATLENGAPFTSAVNYLYQAGESWGKAYFLMSDLARHTRNVKMNPNISLQIIESSSLPLYQRKRISIQGVLTKVREQSLLDFLRQNYLQCFPESKIFFTLADFHFYEMMVSEVYFIGGFGKIESLK